ncbi:tubulin binding cofactor C-domain-containing protein [Stachybotrys elegans]|uniref:Tubulin binding cofactor C-domain-containing protein n=1 Tax=Stachybotrys elegans TaxID=80388 RepID=A0A8K0SVT2_9HYPO|nr:tubulin binding cofactor C-domain-containing protein [Stachybotrys elegans]
MEAQTQLPTHPGPSYGFPIRTTIMDPKQRFYRHFLDSVAILQDQMGELESLATIGGERQAAIDHILAGVAKLQNEVADAADFTPAYDRRQYSEAIKTLQEQLNQKIARVTPKSRFQFKRSSKVNHVDMGAPENDPRLNPGSLSRTNHAQVEARLVRVNEQEPPADAASPKGKDYNAEIQRPNESRIRTPSFSAAQSIAISNHSGLHIILPPAAAHATAAGSLTDLKSCIVDMSIPTVQGSAFAGLAIKNVSSSLIVAGRVSGPVHITGVADSILVITAHQVRIHECSNVDIYLHCGSHPIIEDCDGMRFAPLPEHYLTDAEKSAENQWDQVDDFKWLKAGPSPHWNVLSASERLGDAVWKDIVPGKAGTSVEETLKKVGIPRN